MYTYIYIYMYIYIYIYIIYIHTIIHIEMPWLCGLACSYWVMVGVQFWAMHMAYQ